MLAMLLARIMEFEGYFRDFLVGLVQKTRTKTICTNSLSIVHMKPEINFRFHMYDKKIYKCDVTGS